MFDQFWHKWLKRPYKLRCIDDVGSSNETVVLLHGIGSSAQVWRHLVPRLADHCRVLTFDLLGFGASPKPGWPDYSADDHAKAVIASLRAKNVRKPIILVGHSMGCLVATHVAKLEPRLVKQLILYEMPLYVGLPDTRRYNKRRDLYFLIYNHIMESPDLALTTKQSVRRLIAKFSGFEISEETWRPFVKSLKNTIISQTTLDDIKQLSLPIDIIYGSLDMLVIRGTPKKIFGHEATHIQTHTITELHSVSPKASSFLAKRILRALGRAPVSTPALGRRSKLRAARRLTRSHQSEYDERNLHG